MSRDDPCIPADVETVFMANTYRFIQEQTTRDTKFVFVDYKGSNARVSPQQAMNEVRQAGFEVIDFDIDGCPDHYILTFKAG
ncbi:hypothetical protein [Vibrio sp. MEBiC08052]|uniref:hypothetical protein n=1 Tax=Vibrio sp. MEBiC08052 TaxID=1761910 RepID=UPI0007406071|nr:hypothetical protein [Vibrio sp. MEBiC08052]KUI98280.1 hypothetical protein VRK_29810 [Vibrio sp. MEBiC08052]